jgi:hypothetical protein
MRAMMIATCRQRTHRSRPRPERCRMEVSSNLPTPGRIAMGLMHGIADTHTGERNSFDVSWHSDRSRFSMAEDLLFVIDMPRMTQPHDKQCCLSSLLPWFWVIHFQGTKNIWANEYYEWGIFRWEELYFGQKGRVNGDPVALLTPIFLSWWLRKWHAGAASLPPASKLTWRLLNIIF